MKNYDDDYEDYLASLRGTDSDDAMHNMQSDAYYAEDDDKNDDDLIDSVNDKSELVNSNSKGIEKNLSINNIDLDDKYNSNSDYFGNDELAYSPRAFSDIVTDPQIEILSGLINGITEASAVRDILSAVETHGSKIFSDPMAHAAYLAVEKVINEGRTPSVGILSDYLKNKAEMFDGKPDYYLESVMLTPSAFASDQVDACLSVLIDKHKKRETIREAEMLNRMLADEEHEADASQIITRLRGIEAIMESGTSQVETAGDVAHRVFTQSTPTWYVSTGITEVDRVLGGAGMAAGMLTVVAGRAKTGKTIFLNSVLLEILKRGVTPIVLNLETRDVEFMAKMMSRLVADPECEQMLKDSIILREWDEYDEQDLEGYGYSKEEKQVLRDHRAMLVDAYKRCNFDSLRSDPGRYSLFGWGTIARYISKNQETIERFSDADHALMTLLMEWAETQNWILSFDRKTTLTDLSATIQEQQKEKTREYQEDLADWEAFVARKVMAAHESGDDRSDEEIISEISERLPKPEDPKIVVLIDYLGLMVQDSMREREELTQLTKGLKGLAIDHGVSVMALAQLNRGADNSVPRAADLRGSGSIEQDADTVIALYNQPTSDDDEGAGFSSTDTSDITMVTVPVARHSGGGDFMLMKDAAHQYFTVDNAEIPESFDEDLMEEIVNTGNSRRAKLRSKRGY